MNNAQYQHYARLAQQRELNDAMHVVFAELLADVDSYRDSLDECFDVADDIRDIIRRRAATAGVDIE